MITRPKVVCVCPRGGLEEERTSAHGEWSEKKRTSAPGEWSEKKRTSAPGEWSEKKRVCYRFHRGVSSLGLRVVTANPVAALCMYNWLHTSRRPHYSIRKKSPHSFENFWWYRLTSYHNLFFQIFYT
ncbi:hypothetical protein Zmor_005740 [Zophobas morio]|uniref:Uncharacterized protein n=1 Tax=Zophobas morio TaxID=2755281 RepID=A0AA38MMC9_9CUCU|nr:hypothetical protein Zmor_005740 [Zophobas morio]